MKKTIFPVASLLILSACASTTARIPSANNELSESQKKVVRDTTHQFQELVRNFEEIGLQSESGALYLGINATEQSKSMGEMMRSCEIDSEVPRLESQFFTTGKKFVKYNVGGAKCPLTVKSNQFLDVVDNRPNGSFKYSGSASLNVNNEAFAKLSKIRDVKITGTGETIHQDRFSSATSRANGSFNSVDHGNVAVQVISSTNVTGGKKWYEDRTIDSVTELKLEFSEFTFRLEIKIQGVYTEETNEEEYKKNFLYYVNGQNISQDELFSDYLSPGIVKDMYPNWPAMSFYDGLKHFHNPWLHR